MNRSPTLNMTSALWVEGISAECPKTLTQLTNLLTDGLARGLPEQSTRDHQRWAAAATQTIQQILPKYSGRSQFTTWAYKIAVRTAFADIRTVGIQQ